MMPIIEAEIIGIMTFFLKLVYDKIQKRFVQYDLQSNGKSKKYLSCEQYITDPRWEQSLFF